MHTRTIKLLLPVILVAMVLSSCKKDFGDINTSPNAPATPSTKFLFGSAVLGVTTTRNTAGALYVQHMAEFIYTQESRYLNRIFNYDPIYAGPLMDLQTIINLNTDAATKNTKAILDNGTNNNQLGHARILKAYFMLHITDRWGDVPYKEAFQGGGNTKPVFDKQRDIYVDLLKELKEATAQITGGLSNDPLFDGNANAWKTWGNSLRAIIALRMSRTADAELGKTAFNEAVTAGIMGSNADNAIYKYLSNANYENPFYTNYTRSGRYDYGTSATFIDKLKATSDPRLPIFARPSINNTSLYIGLPYGKNEYYDYADFSLLGRAIYAQNAPLQITTYAQMCYTMAEAALRGWVSGGDATVATWYEKGINASMDQWAAVSTNPVVTVSAQQKNDYRIQATINIAAANTLSFEQKLERIQTQKWLNFYVNNIYESWAEWRRTGYPVLTPALDPLNTDGKIPRRQCYPLTEKDLNSAHYAEVLSSQGPDELSTRMWWDK
ncbi:SusD/RagB family nutrient-binding outer membrane lipoprotein [Paraflavitalea speifideaquila]|uniref:SusD/RagB family nutrient-binding outer membrane lipoprotein n=1 Tax=Paraflavitalea speifideaquila TaxID=3076558 RepID=UPI0028E5374D|nr:SusD/RagB family nutrient-binding outer membrane lipoprotein [Paraflavitalea speifideiaquila]